MQESHNPYTPPAPQLEAADRSDSQVPAASGLVGPYGRYCKNSLLGKILVFLLVLEVICNGLDLGIQNFNVRNLPFDQYSLDQIEILRGFLLGSFAFYAMLFLALIATMLLFCLWTYRCSKNAWLFAKYRTGTRLSFTPHWSVGWYFIPIAFFWKPFLAMREIRQESQSTRTGKSPVVGLWWAFWLTDFATSCLFSFHDAPSYKLSLVSAFISTGLCIFTILLIRQINHLQVETHLKLEKWSREPFQRN
ncbi:DUF4328 domain-containing protein [Luteolibacter pohnpeiensis]|uniref:DUF4328 domain-containing protein n=1 Tax=Luteolibacter pohnpeiensis TaxID=454153 RepID=A0A934S3G2_9BACT|nr:DUF4328 domain-containing protein [Luteolibacter pohnpeiensis]MBK1881771.1 DUF4328 domain-containing protein [Luteolibacter pohnpeiensis]